MRVIRFGERGGRLLVAIAVIAATVTISLATSQREARADTQTVCLSSPIPSGWVVTSFRYSLSCGPGTGGYNAMTIAKPFNGIVACYGSTIPSGWVITGYRSTPICGSTSTYNAMTISTPREGIVACFASTIPPGWVITGYQTSPNCGSTFGGPNAFVLSSTATPPPPAVHGSISASPSTLTLPPGTTGSTVVSWSVSGFATEVDVYVRLEGGSQSLFSSSKDDGSATATWIVAPQVYVFSLYQDGYSDPAHLLASTTVRGVLAPTSTISASPSVVTLPPDTPGSTVVSWNATPGTNVDVYVTLDGGAQSPMATGGATGSVTAPWIVAPHQYVFKLYPTGYSDPAHLLASTTVHGVLA